MIGKDGGTKAMLMTGTCILTARLRLAKMFEYELIATHIWYLGLLRIFSIESPQLSIHASIRLNCHTAHNNN